MEEMNGFLIRIPLISFRDITGYGNRRPSNLIPQSEVPLKLTIVSYSIYFHRYLLALLPYFQIFKPNSFHLIPSFFFLTSYL